MSKHDEELEYEEKYNCPECKCYPDDKHEVDCELGAGVWSGVLSHDEQLYMLETVSPLGQTVEDETE